MTGARDKIRALVDRIERLDEELTALNSDKSEVYKEARAQGFDVPALKACVSYRRRRDKVGPLKFDERETVFASYMAALDGVGTPVAIARATPDRPPHDPDPNEIPEPSDPLSEVEQSAPDAGEVAEAHGEPFPDLPDFLDRRKSPRVSVEGERGSTAPA